MIISDFHTHSTASDGKFPPKEVVKKAVSVAGAAQKAPYVQGDIDLTDKAAVEEEDRKRFSFMSMCHAHISPSLSQTMLFPLGEDAAACGQRSLFGTSRQTGGGRSCGCRRLCRQPQGGHGPLAAQGLLLLCAAYGILQLCGL